MNTSKWSVSTNGSPANKRVNSQLIASLLATPVLIPALGWADWSEHRPATNSQPQLEEVDEVVVTAQKRQEMLQDLPISITAISGSQLETRGIQGVVDLSGLAPNFVFHPSGSSGSIAILAIRGSMTIQPAVWMGSQIGTYVDGVYIGKAQGGIFDLLDLERVEVLRGPQGTLFDSNTEGGAVNVVTRKPSGKFGGSVGLEVGNYESTVERVMPVSHGSNAYYPMLYGNNRNGVPSPMTTSLTESA